MVYFQEGRIVTDTCILVATEFPVRFILSVTVRSSFCLFTATQGLLEIVYQTRNLSARIYARYRGLVLSESGIPGRMSREPDLPKVLHPESRKGTEYTGLNPRLQVGEYVWF